MATAESNFRPSKSEAINAQVPWDRAIERSLNYVRRWSSALRIERKRSTELPHRDSSAGVIVRPITFNCETLDPNWANRTGHRTRRTAEIEPPRASMDLSYRGSKVVLPTSTFVLRKTDERDFDGPAQWLFDPHLQSARKFIDFS